MKYQYYFCVLILINNAFICTSYCQSWEKAGDVNYPVTRMYVDTIEDVMYIGGGFKYFDSVLVNGIAIWDGDKAMPLGSGRTRDCGLTSCFDLVLLTKYNDDIYIGKISDTIDGVEAKGIARWDGKKWSNVGSGVFQPSSGNSGIPFDGYVLDERLLVGGAFEMAGADTAYSLAAWDGSNWYSLDVPKHTVPGNTHFITSVVHFKNDLYIAGNFIMDLTSEMTHDIACYKNGVWTSVGGGLSGGLSYVQDMIVYKGELYICGYFQLTSGNIGNKIMRWDGNKWKSVGEGLCSPFDIAERMFVHNEKLYVVGIFDCVGAGIPASCIATWDGNQWCSLGRSKFDNKIRDIAIWKNEVYIGGGFTEIDGQPVKYFAKWVGDHSTDTCSAPIVSAQERPDSRPALALRPNPVSDVLRVALPRAAAAVRVYDLAGRDMSGKTGNRNVGEVHNLADVYGDSEIELGVGALPPGWYLLQVVFRDGSSAAAGFVKM